MVFYFGTKNKTSEPISTERCTEIDYILELNICYLLSLKKYKGLNQKVVTLEGETLSVVSLVLESNIWIKFTKIGCKDILYPKIAQMLFFILGEIRRTKSKKRRNFTINLTKYWGVKLLPIFFFSSRMKQLKRLYQNCINR